MYIEECNYWIGELNLQILSPYKGLESLYIMLRILHIIYWFIALEHNFEVEEKLVALARRVLLVN